MERTITIGNKNLSDLTADNILQIVKIEGCAPAPEFWHDPKLLDFNNTMFSDTIVIDYQSIRKSDGKESYVYTLFFNFKDFRFSYLNELERNDKYHQPRNKRVKLETIKYLIKEGFNIPLY